MFPVQKKEDEAEQPREPDDHEKTLSWTEMMLKEECGFNPLQAAAVAEAGRSWHDAKDLLDRGCDVETAVDLLL